MRILVALVALLTTATEFGGLVHAASFDCTRAASLVEHAVCDDPDISRMDDELTKIYRSLRQQDPSLVLSQRAWLAERDGCQTLSCVRVAYERRLAQLKTTPPVTTDWSPAGHYERTPKGNPEGEMVVQRDGGHWRVAIQAGGIPNGGNTAADCAIVGDGGIAGRTFRGEIKFNPDNDKWNSTPSSEDAVESGRALTIQFNGPQALVEAETFGICGERDGISGSYRVTPK